MFTLGGGVVVVGRCRLRRRPRVRLSRRTAGRFGIIVSTSIMIYKTGQIKIEKEKKRKSFQLVQPNDR